MRTRSERRARQAGAPKRRTAAARANPQIQYFPATPERWRDLEQLFGPRGACGGCWCMWLRLPRAQFEQCKGEANRQALQGLVGAGRIPGLLAYSDGQPVGWCSVAPREEFPRLEASRTLGRIDDRPVWSVVCFYVAKPWRRRGITVGLLRAAAAYAHKQGATLVEGYPVVPKRPDMPAVFAWPGFVAAFRQVGFTEVARRSATRPIMRLPLRTPRRTKSGGSFSR